MRGVLRSRELLMIGIVVCGGGIGSAPVCAQFCEQEHKLLPADGVVDDLFGGSIALSGSTALIGSFRDDDNGNFSGAAYVFNASTGAQEHKLLSNDGATNDFFGFSVSIHGTRALIGAPGDSDNGFFSGSAYLFDLTTGNQIRKFTANDGTPSDNFGYAVALSGTTAIIGAWGDDDAGTDAGAVYLFDTTTGAQLDRTIDSGFRSPLMGTSQLPGRVWTMPSGNFQDRRICLTSPRAPRLRNSYPTTALRAMSSAISWALMVTPQWWVRSSMMTREANRVRRISSMRRPASRFVNLPPSMVRPKTCLESVWQLKAIMF